jgi:pimeloyl-ACP methyl ester carboxylesterase
MQNRTPFADQPGETPPVSSPPSRPSRGQRGRPRRWVVLLVSLVCVLAVVEGIALVVLTGLPQSLLRRVTPSPPHATAVTTAMPAQSFRPTSAFQAASCPFKLGEGVVEGQMVKCGYVMVPENRSASAGRTVQLAVAIFKNSKGASDPFPVLRLEGGPGGASLDDWAHYITSTNFTQFVFHHDLIMFDQRGTGYSQPSLKCPELLQLQYTTLDQHLSRERGEQLSVQAARACDERLVKSGIDLNAYNTLENAADVHDLIQVLGYKQVTLYGVSYGTRLALTIMRLYPSVIHAVILDSVYPPQKNRTDVPAAAQRVFQVLFQGCAISTSCRQQYPQLDIVFYQLVNNLNAQTATFQTTNPSTGKQYMVSFAGDDLIFWLFSALYVTEFIPLLPETIFQIRNHDSRLLSQIYGAVEFDDTFSDGMFYSTTCAEDWAFLTQQAIAKAVQNIASPMQPVWMTELQQEYDICQLWHVKQLPAVQRQAVTSNLPTLILSGEYDPITPPENGKLVAQTLTDSTYFLFPGMGHGEEYNAGCTDAIITAFEDNPAQKPSGACIRLMSEPDFQ